MKKLILTILPVLLSFAMILPNATAVLAADTEEDVTSELAARARLLIRAPDTAEAGQSLTFIIYGSHNHEPVAGAEVYTLKNNKIAGTADLTNDTAPTELNAGLIYIGITDDEGNVTHAFRQTGRYLLIAFKTGFMPGLSYIAITPSMTSALVLRLPDSGEMGQPVSMGVFDRSTQQPVSGAAIYARHLAVSGVTKPAVASFFRNIIGVVMHKKVEQTTSDQVIGIEQGEPAAEVQDVEDIQRRGFLLGYTNDDGKLVYTFDRPGYYVLTAMKENYSPAFARLNITSDEQQALGIKAPGRAVVNSPVLITVFERGTSQVVPKAGVYALRLGDILTVAPAARNTTTILTPTPKPVEVTAEADIHAEAVRSRGFLLGYADDRGRLEYSFENTGRYVLAAFPDDYIPGFARITIVPVETVSPEKVESVPLSVSNSLNSKR